MQFSGKFYFFTRVSVVLVARAGVGDRGAVTSCGLPEPDPGSQSPGHGPERQVRRVGMSGGKPSTFVQGISGWQQTGQRRAA